MDEVKRWDEKHDLVGRDLPVLQNQLDELAQAGKRLFVDSQAFMATWTRKPVDGTLSPYRLYAS